MAPFLRTPLTRSTQIYQLFGANTSVGKTVVSTALCSALRSKTQSKLKTQSQKEKQKQKDVLFLKPVSTGPGEDSDELYVLLLLVAKENYAYAEIATYPGTSKTSRRAASTPSPSP